MMFGSPFEHIRAELSRLDLLLHRQILRLRASYQLSLDEFRGLYISDQQVDSLINQAAAQGRSIPSVNDLTEKGEALRKANAEKMRGDLPWKHVVKEFGLSQFEQDVLLLALAPEVDLKYETLYAYLNNDVTRKWPTCDLALWLFSLDSVQRSKFSRHLLPGGTLFGCGLLQRVQQPSERPSWLATGFSLAPSLSHHLQDLSYSKCSLAPFLERIEPCADWSEVPIARGLREILQRAAILFETSLTHEAGPLLIFLGRDGSGKKEAAGALCGDLGLPLLCLDLEAARASQDPVSKLIQGLALQHRLEKTALYIERCEAFFDKDGKPIPEAYTAIKAFNDLKGPVILSFAPGALWHEFMTGCRHLVFRFEDPDFRDRLALWHKYVAQRGFEVAKENIEAVAVRFVLTPGQIEDAVSTAVHVSYLKAGCVKMLDGDTLFDGARQQSDQSLGNLAVKVNPIHTWEDMVLPPATLRQLKDIAAAIKYRHVVYSEWGFNQRIASGKGLKVLFSGVSGTGKTMAAEVIGRHLGLDLYKIDLSGVVSKYIGETEKNLDQIFRAAHCSNAILFFDEADALFGKRSEVKDAHDRYANIEVAYLLQKLEEHDGAVILATNLSKNIDEAFARRMHYVVRFPLPDATDRERLWRGMFPAQAPVDDTIDFEFIASQFSFVGGDIKNIALDTAFRAASDGRVITMAHLLRAIAQHLIKQGRSPTVADFRQYYDLLADQL